MPTPIDNQELLNKLEFEKNERQSFKDKLEEDKTNLKNLFDRGLIIENLRGEYDSINTEIYNKISEQEGEIAKIQNIIAGAGTGGENLAPGPVSGSPPVPMDRLKNYDAVVDKCNANIAKITEEINKIKQKITSFESEGTTDSPNVKKRNKNL